MPLSAKTKIIWGFMLENTLFTPFEEHNHTIIEKAYRERKRKPSSHSINIIDGNLPKPCKAKVYFGVAQNHLRMPGTRYYVHRITEPFSPSPIQNRSPALTKHSVSPRLSSCSQQTLSPISSDCSSIMSSLEPSSYSNDSHLATTTTTTTTPLLMNDTSPSMMTCNSTPSNQLWYNSIIFDENNNRFDYFSSLPFTEESLLSTTSHPYYDQKEEDVYHSTHSQDDFIATNDSYRYSHPTTITTKTYYSRDKMGHLNHDIYSWHEPSSTISHLDPSPPTTTNEAVLMDTKWLDEFLFNIHTVSWPHILPSTIEPYKINNIYHDCATHFFPDNHFGYP